MVQTSSLLLLLVVLCPALSLVQNSDQLFDLIGEYLTETTKVGERKGGVTPTTSTSTTEDRVNYAIRARPGNVPATAATAVSKASKAEIIIAVIELVFGIVSEFVSKIKDEQRDQELWKELRNIENRFDVLSYNLQRNFADLHRDLSLNQIDKEVTELNAIKSQYKYWLANNPTNTQIETFQSVCEAKQVWTKPGFFSEIFTSNDHIRSPRAQFLELNHRSRYLKFASSMVGYFISSVFLHGVCTGLKGNSEDGNITVTKNGIIFQNFLNEMNSVISSDVQLIKSRFWNSAIQDMDEYLARYSTDTHARFAHALHQHLTEKYDFREWLVISYGDNSFYGHGDHTCYPSPAEQIYNNTLRSSFFYNAVRRKGRNVILASPNQIESTSLRYDFSRSSAQCFEAMSIEDREIEWEPVIGPGSADEPLRATEVLSRLKSCSFTSSLEPVIRFVFMNRSGFEIVNNSPLAAARRMQYVRAIKVPTSVAFPVIYEVVAVLIA